MANLKDIRQRKPVKITLLDGVERTVKFTLNAMAEIEDRYGSVEKGFYELEENNSIKALRCILWAGFIEDEPEITERQVGSLIDIAYMDELMELLGQAFEQDMPDQNNPQTLPAGNIPPVEHADGSTSEDGNPNF